MHPHDEEFIDRIFSLVDREPSMALMFIAPGGITSWQIWELKVLHSYVTRKNYYGTDKHRCIAVKQRLLWQSDPSYVIKVEENPRQYSYAASQIITTREQLKNRMMIEEEKERAALTQYKKTCEDRIQEYQFQLANVLQSEEILDNIEVPPEVWEKLPT